MDKDGNIHEVANRRVFFDFTFSPPKSVSIAALVGDDQRIMEAHDEAVQVAMRQLEMYAATRVRKRESVFARLTGNLVGAVFRHDTSTSVRPAFAHPLHPVQCHEGFSREPLEGIGNLRNADGQKIHDSGLLP